MAERAVPHIGGADLNFYISTAYLPIAETFAIAKAADRLGFDGLGIPDHVVDFAELTTPYPYTRDGKTRWEPFTDWPDPWVLIGGLAQCTSTLRFVTTVYIPALRDPFTAAKAIGTASTLSGGRLELGIGVGWSKDEFDLLGARFAGRGKRTDEMISLMRDLWTPGWTTFDGDDYPTPPVEMSPTPPHIPVFVGGLTDRALKRAARYDGWVGDLITTAGAADVAERLHSLRSDVGRAETAFTIIAPLIDAITPDDYRQAAHIGITHVLTMPWMFYSGPDATTEQKIEDMARFRTDVLDPLRCT